jgi:signal transduction histidine kinase
MIIDLRHGEVVFTNSPGQNIDWINHALVLLSEENPIWVEQSDRLASVLSVRDSAPLLLQLQDGAVTRLVVQYYPQSDEERKRARKKFFQNLLEVVANTRSRNLTSEYYQSAARRLQESNTRMKQLFSNVRHNLGNTLSTVMTGIGQAILFIEEEPADRDMAITVLQNNIAPNYKVSFEMVKQLQLSIDALIEEDQKYDLKTYQLSALFTRYFGAWLLDQQKQIAARVDLSWEIPEDLYIQTSDLVFFQSVWNVLKNAIKYTRSEKRPQKGEIHISTFLGDDDRIYLRVKDTGPGIPLEQQENIGKYGYRGAHKDKVEGEGIGLWGTYQLVEAVDGYIYFKSTPGVGTEFNIGFQKGDE